MKTTFTVTTQIRATPAQVFWFLADPSTASVIDPAVVTYEPDGGTMGLGVTNRARLRMMGLPVTLTTETVTWEPGRAMGFRSVRPARPAIGVATHLFEECRDGTSYSWSMTFVPTSFGGRVVSRVAVGLFERNAVLQQERVRIVIEAALRGSPCSPST